MSFKLVIAGIVLAMASYNGSVTQPHPQEGLGNVVDASEYVYEVEPVLEANLTASGALYEEDNMDTEQVVEWEEEDTPEPVIDYDNNLYILAHLIAGEAMGCSWDLQAAVGSVVLNRVNHYAFPSSIYGVVFDPGQYACTWDGNYYREPTETNWEVARYLLENGSTLPWYVIFQSSVMIGDSYYTQIENVIFSYNSYDVN